VRTIYIDKDSTKIKRDTFLWNEYEKSTVLK